MANNQKKQFVVKKNNLLDNNSMIHSKYALTAKDKNKDVDFEIKYNDYNIEHDHDYFEFFIILFGKYKTFLNNEKYLGRPYEAYFIRPSDLHRIVAEDRKVKHVNIMFKTQFVKKHCDCFSKDLYPTILKQKNIKLQLDQIVVEKMLSILNSTNNGKEESDQLAYSLVFNEIIDLIVSQLNLLNRNMPTWLVDIINTINSVDNFHLTVDEIINQSNYSHTHMSRLFKKTMGMSIVKYMQTVKLNYAAKYLVYSDKDVFEISNILGFSNVSHFNHIFKETYKMTPLEYRKTQSKDSKYEIKDERK